MMKSLYVPTNGIALVEIEAKTGAIQPVKIHEVNFSERIYSHRKDVVSTAKAVDKTFISGEQHQKMARLSQDLCLSAYSQTEPTESISKDYFLSIRFVPLGKKNYLEGSFYFNRRLEKKGKIREIFDQFMELERMTTEFR